jgi:ABC-type multidrug transport system ATPase subunit
MWLWFRIDAHILKTVGLPVRGLHGIQSAADDSTFVSVIGLSGCGKSTFLRVVSGRIQITSGQVSLAGHPVHDLQQNLPLAIGYLPQFGAFHAELTVLEILDNAARFLPASATNGWIISLILPGFGPSWISPTAPFPVDRCDGWPWQRN